jgi:hypothetical protein
MKTIKKRADETLFKMIDRSAKKIRVMSPNELREFINQFFPKVKIKNKGIYKMTNPYSGRESIVDNVQASLADFIVNYESYMDKDVKDKFLELQPTAIYQANNLNKFFEIERQKHLLVEDWHGARLLVRCLWPELYREQID